MRRNCRHQLFPLISNSCHKSCRALILANGAMSRGPTCSVCTIRACRPARMQFAASRHLSLACPAITLSTKTARSHRWFLRLCGLGTRAFRIGKVWTTSIPAPSGSKSIIPGMMADIPNFRMPKWPLLKGFAWISSIAMALSRAAFLRIRMSPRIGRSIPAKNSIGRGWLSPALAIGRGPLTLVWDVLVLGDTGAGVMSLQRNSASMAIGSIRRAFDGHTAIVVAAFQRHFRPALVDGRADRSTVETLDALLGALPVAECWPPKAECIQSRVDGFLHDRRKRKADSLQGSPLATEGLGSSRHRCDQRKHASQDGNA